MKIKNIILIALGSAAALTVVSCEKKGPAEKAGENMDEAVEDTKDAAEDAKDATKDKMEEMGDKIEDATDN
ncbi:MAG: hypothetical protein ACSHX6_12310 [Akkermansiaceae bacterium]